MFLVATPIIFLAAFASCIAITQALRHRPLGLAAALAAALLVCLETLLLNALSVFQAVGRPGLMIGNVVIVATGFLVLRWRRGSFPGLRWPHGASRPWLLPVAAIGLLAAVSAAAYRPNNWDSMTYHLARVAHWYQNHSVFPYPSNVSRQLALSPGAEHLLLVLQVLAGSDAYANMLQFGAWVVVVAVAPAMARSFGAPRRVAPWGALLVAAAPMALLQASSTQNDLVAAAMSVAMVVASLPFLHRRRRWTPADVALLLAAVTGGLLVKPTSLVAAAPFLAWGLLRTARDLGSAATWRRLLPAGLALALALGAIGPSLQARRASHQIGDVLKPFLYAGADDLGDRAVNSIRGALRNIPISGKLADRLSPPQTIGCDRANSLCTQYNLQMLHEDMTGNLGLALLFVLAVPVGLFRLRSLPRRAPLAMLCLGASWLLFHALLRDNLWITRLQLPLFALAPIALCTFSSPWFARGLRGAAMGVLLTGLVAHGALAAVLNARRPLDPTRLGDAHRPQAYYVMGPAGVMEAHATALDILEKSSCRRMGIYITEDSYDYPLTWRAMLLGAEVRHVMGPDDWPCMVFSDRGPPPGRPSGEAWRQVAPNLFVVP
jgi:hypothetical protein